MKHTAPKTIIIGLDGATFDLLLPLIQKGQMPHLQTIMERGSWGRLNSTIPPFTATAWSSFITGQNPGEHGILSFQKRDIFNYDLKGSGFVNATYHDQTLWELFNEAGFSTGVVNVPLTFPPRPIDGYMITGMLTPPGTAQFTYPSDLRSDIADDYLIDVDFIRDGQGFRQGGFPTKIEMLEQIRRMTAIRVKTCLHTLEAYPTDFFMVVFTGTDRISHFFWDDLEVLIKEGSQSTAPSKLLYDGLLAYFRELDEGIGQLTAISGKDSTVFIMSDHGFGPAPTRRFYINLWLEQLGLLSRRQTKGIIDLEYWRVRIGRNKALKSIISKLIPPKTQTKAKKVAEHVSGEIFDWTKTKAYFVPIYFHVCGIELNLVEERRNGIVQSGAEYESIREQIIQACRSLYDPETARPIVLNAYRREVLYNGRNLQQIPDIILELDPDYIPMTSLASSQLVEMGAPPFRPGEHRQDGIFIAAGPYIQVQDELPGLNLIDVSPTAHFASGTKIPSSYDGRVITEIFTPEYLTTHPITTYDPAPGSTEPEKPFTPKDEDELTMRLRGLGYLD